jgi:Phospholipase_D-nuclease N-terminal
VTAADVGFWSLEVGGLLWIAVTIVWICGIVDLMTKRPDLDGRHRAAWILIILLFPLIGTLAYFFVRPTLLTSGSGCLQPNDRCRTPAIATTPCLPGCRCKAGGVITRQSPT